MPLTSSVAFIYPRLFSMRNLDEFVGALDTDGSPQLPSALPLSIFQETAASRGGKKVRIEESDDAFLIEDSVGIYIFLGGSVPPEFLESVLQINTLAGVDCSQLRIHPLQNDDSIRVNRLINGIRSQRPHLFQSTRVLVSKDPSEARFLSMLTEDRAQTSMEYTEFLCHVHRQIQQKFVY